MEERERQQIIEALLFSSPHVLTSKQLADILSCESQAIQEVVATINREYEETQRAFHIESVSGGWQFRTRPQFRPWIQKLEPIKPIRLSLPTVETLAIIAYKQPITRTSIEAIRGVDCSYTVRTLLQKKLIKIVGKEAIPGRPILYGTSKQFLEVFGLTDLKSLPPLSELQSLLQQEELPASLEDTPLVSDSESAATLSILSDSESVHEDGIPGPSEILATELAEVETIHNTEPTPEALEESVLDDHEPQAA